MKSQHQMTIATATGVSIAVLALAALPSFGQTKQSPSPHNPSTTPNAESAPAHNPGMGDMHQMMMQMQEMMQKCQSMMEASTNSTEQQNHPTNSTEHQNHHPENR